MLSRDLLRERPAEVKERLAFRGVDVGLVDRWGELDRERRTALVDVEARKQQRNESSKRIGEKKRTGGDAAEEIASVGAVKDRIERHDARLGEIDASLHELELKLPNLPDDDVPAGADESANRVERVVGAPRSARDRSTMTTSS